MATTIFSRHRWEEPGYSVAEHTTSPPVDQARINALVWHWPGTLRTDPGAFITVASAILGVVSKLVQYLRNTQRYYVDFRKYSIGYNWKIATNGDIIECRGWRFRNAANKGYNATTISVQIIQPLFGVMPKKQIAAAQWFDGYITEQLGRQLAHKTHGEVGNTACPGPDIGPRVQRGDFRAPIVAPPEPPQPPVQPPIIPITLTSTKEMLMRYIVPGPARLIDTRDDGADPLEGGKTHIIKLPGLPEDAKVLELNMTAVCSTPGFAAVFGWGAWDHDDASSINYSTSGAIANRVSVVLAGDKSFRVYTSTAADFIFDLVGWSAEVKVG